MFVSCVYLSQIMSQDGRAHDVPLHGGEEGLGREGPVDTNERLMRMMEDITQRLARLEGGANTPPQGKSTSIPRKERSLL